MLYVRKTKMTFANVKEYFENKRELECKITDELVAGGYRQKRGGYIKIALEKGEINPSQWWHLMNYCQMKKEKNEEHKSYRFTPCGELVFWMAEVSDAVTKNDLLSLKNKILSSGEIGNRRKWNNEIKDVCWYKVREKIESAIL